MKLMEVEVGSKMVNNNGFPDPTELVKKQRKEHEREKLRDALAQWRAEAKLKKQVGKIKVKKVKKKKQVSKVPKQITIKQMLRRSGYEFTGAIKQVLKRPTPLPRLKKYRKYLVPTRRIVIRVRKER